MRRLGPTSDFTRIASRYDATRDVPPRNLKACHQRLIEQGYILRNGVVLDAGSGTGQTSLALAEMGIAVRGYDISPAMAAIAQSKCRPD